MKRDTPKYVLGLSLLFGCLFPVSIPAQNTPGVTDNEILIGSCSALEGPSHFLGTETVTGAKAYFAMINEAGGVDGRKLKLVAYDDSYDPAKKGSVLQPFDGTEGFRIRLFRGHAHCREIHSDGREQQDSRRRSLHRSSDAVCAAAALGGERSRVLFR